MDWQMLGYLMSQAGGALGKAGGTPLGDAAAGLSDVTNKMVANRNMGNAFAKIMGMQPEQAAGVGTPGGVAPTGAPQSGVPQQPQLTTTAQPSQLNNVQSQIAPVQGAQTQPTQMMPDRLVDMVNNPKSNIASATWKPDGSFTVGERKQSELGNVMAGGGGSTSNSPFVEALLRLV